MLLKGCIFILWVWWGTTCNSGGEGKYYLQLQPNVRIAQLRNGQLPDGFVDKQGLSEHNKKVEADKKAVEIAKDRAEQIQAKNAALQRKVIADFKKDSATQINNVCQNITSIHSMLALYEV